jgi:hypothetical protein
MDSLAMVANNKDTASKATVSPVPVSPNTVAMDKHPLGLELGMDSLRKADTHHSSLDMDSLPLRADTERDEEKYIRYPRSVVLFS